MKLHLIRMLFILTLFINIFGHLMIQPVYAQSSANVPQCSNYIIEHQSIFSKSSTSLPNTIYPVDKELKFTISKQGLIWNTNNQFAFFDAHIYPNNNQGGNSTGIVAKIGSADLPINADISTDNITITLGQDSRIKKADGTTEQFIPFLNHNQVNKIDLVLLTDSVIPTSATQLNSRLNEIRANPLCKITLNFIGQCDAYPDFEGKQEYITENEPNLPAIINEYESINLIFDNNSYALPNNITDQTPFQLKLRFNNNSAERNPFDIQAFTSIDKTYFNLRSDNTNLSPYFDGLQERNVSLYQDDNLICSYSYTPLHKDLYNDYAQCNVVPIKDINDIYTGSIEINKLPSIFPSINRSTVNLIPINYKINPLTLLTTDKITFNEISKNQGDLPEGFYSITNRNICSDNRIYCDSLNTSDTNFNPQKVSINRSLTTKGSYVSALIYEDRTGYGQSFKTLLPCIGSFDIGETGTVIITTPTPPSPKDELRFKLNKDICNYIEHEDGEEVYEQGKPGTNYQKCLECVSNKDEGAIWTAIGCIDTNISGLVKSFFTIGLGLAGGIALLFFIYGGFLVLTSQGNSEQVQQGREIVVSAIAGLLLIIFSVVIIQLVAIDIIKIPGFGRSLPNNYSTVQPTTTQINGRIYEGSETITINQGNPISIKLTDYNSNNEYNTIAVLFDDNNNQITCQQINSTEFTIPSPQNPTLGYFAILTTYKTCDNADMQKYNLIRPDNEIATIQYVRRIQIN